MAKLEVTQYSMKWNPVDNTGSAIVSFSNGQQAQVPIDSSGEFIAVLLMLSKEPVYLDLKSKELELDQRPTGT